MMAHVAAPAGATEVFNKKKDSTVQKIVPKQNGPAATQRQVMPQQQMTPPLAPGSIIPGQPACSEEDKKLVLELDKNLLAKASDDDTPEERSAQSKRWQENFKTPESMKNFIMLYIRCASVVAAKREEMGMGPGKVPLQP